MRLNIRSPFSTAIAIAFGLFVLLGYFLAADPSNPFQTLRGTLLGAAVLLAAVALLMGIVNLLSVHVQKVQDGGLNGAFSGVLIFFLAITLVATLLQGPTGLAPQLLFNAIQAPIEASLMAVLTVSLAYAGVRLWHRKLSPFTLLFAAATLLTLLGSAPILGFKIPLVGDFIKPFLSQVLALAGARGILIGVALGTVATGLRILIGADRPFGG